MAGDFSITGGDLLWRSGGDPVVDLARTVGDPTRCGTAQFHPPDGRVVPEEPVAAVRQEKRDADFGIALYQVEHYALLVQTPVGMLAQPEEAFVLISGEGLLKLLVTVPCGREIARSRPPKMDRLFG